MLSKEEAYECFKDPLYMESGSMKDTAIAREREQIEEARKAADGKLVQAFRAGISVRQIARHFKVTEVEIEASIRRRLV